MQRELEHAQRDNTRLEKLVNDLQHQVQQMNHVVMAQAGVGTPMPGVPRQPAPPPAQPMPGGSAMPAPPSFGGDPVFVDAQTAQINAMHPMGGQGTQAEQAAPKRRGRPPGPRKTAAA